MSSREFDDMLDDLLRHALYPFAEAEPPLRVWRRVLRAVRTLHAEREAATGHRVLAGFSMFAGLPVLAGLPATFSRCLGFFSRMRGSNVTYVPLFSNRAYYVDQSGRCLRSPFWDIALTQMFDLRLAS